MPTVILIGMIIAMSNKLYNGRLRTHRDINTNKKKKRKWKEDYALFWKNYFSCKQRSKGSEVYRPLIINFLINIALFISLLVVYVVICQKSGINPADNNITAESFKDGLQNRLMIPATIMFLFNMATVIPTITLVWRWILGVCNFK